MPAILQRSVILKMSTDKDITKSEETMGDEKDAKVEVKSEAKADDGKNIEENDNKEKETSKKRAAKVKEVKKEEVSDDDEEEEENGEEEGEAENDASTKVPLLDQPLQLSGTRERKKVQRFTEEFKSEAKDITIDIPEGTGTALGNIPRIDAEIQRTRIDGLKALHRVLFGKIGKSTLVKKNIRKFNGFDFDKDSDLFEKKKAFVQKMEVRVLRSMCGLLDLEKKGKRDEQAERIVLFLLEPKDSGRPVPTPRPKRKSAVKANSKGYSESEDEEKRPARTHRGKSKRANLKEDSSSESEEETNSQKKKQDKESDKEKESEEEVEEDEESVSDSDEPKSKKKGKTTNAKKATPKKSAKKPASKKAEKKPTPKKKKSTSKSDEEDASSSSSEDEPLAKKAKNPPTDDEIKAYVKEILEDANLEEITMKTVCKQVYAHYPEFDLAHKKDFIKSTVKSLIST